MWELRRKRRGMREEEWAERGGERRVDAGNERGTG